MSVAESRRYRERPPPQHQSRLRQRDGQRSFDDRAKKIACRASGYDVGEVDRPTRHV
jgi:hypothetical protein